MRPSLAASFLVLFSFAGELRAGGVDLEVILSADASRSIDDAEFKLQRKGYAAAASDPRVLNAIYGRPGGSIGICYIAAPRSFMGRTSISSGIDFAVAQIARSKWQVERRIIDISGDGTNISGRSVIEARPVGVRRANHRWAGDYQRQPQSGIFRPQPSARCSAE